jgi:hypothetical protein
MDGILFGPQLVFLADSGLLTVRPTQTDSLLEGSVDIWFREGTSFEPRSYRVFGEYRAVPTAPPVALHAR